MDVFLFRFSAERLRLVPPRHLGFLVASGHCCNELVVLLPYTLFEHDLGDANEIESAFILTRRFTIQRTLISKIVEYGELCEKLFKEMDQAPDALLAEWRKEFEPISAKLKSAKWARILRNKISFHYDPKHALDALLKLENEHPLRLIAGRIKGLTLFDFAEEIVSRPIFEEAGDGDIGKGMDVANRFIVDLVGRITAFHAKSTISAFTRYGMISTREQSQLRKNYTAAPGEVRVPLSLSAEYVAQQQIKLSDAAK